MRAILYYIDEPKPFELHGLQRVVYDDLTMLEAQALMQIPDVRQPGVPMSTQEFRGRVFHRHEDNRVLIYNTWGITDISVADRRVRVTNLITADDLSTLLEERSRDA
jgi:hypothetical protein